VPRPIQIRDIFPFCIGAAFFIIASVFMKSCFLSKIRGKSTEGSLSASDKTGRVIDQKVGIAKKGNQPWFFPDFGSSGQWSDPVGARQLPSAAARPWTGFN